VKHREPAHGDVSRETFPLLGSGRVNSFSERANHELHKLDAAGLRRQPRAVEGLQGPRLRMDGRDVLCLCANDYLGLAAHPLLRRAAQHALEAQGIGAGGPRHIAGNMAGHRAAERALSAFVRQDSAVLFATGYAANLGTVQALLGRGDIVFSDRLNHASLIDGARLSRATVIIYEHADVDDLRRKLEAHRARGAASLILTESLFSMDGDIAPLRSLANLAREFDTGLMVDEAHALGVFGREGRGLCAEQDVLPDVTIGTLVRSPQVPGRS
jgi:7-keto-8-aminopelargonate synthetase-like enzyme